MPTPDLEKEFYEVSLEIQHWQGVANSTSQPPSVRKEAREKVAEAAVVRDRIQKQLTVARVQPGANVRSHTDAELQRLHDQAIARMESINYRGFPCNCELHPMEASHWARVLRPGTSSPCPKCQKLGHAVVAAIGDVDHVCESYNDFRIAHDRNRVGERELAAIRTQASGFYQSLREAANRTPAPAPPREETQWKAGKKQKQKPKKLENPSILTRPKRRLAPRQKKKEKGSEDS